MTGLDPAIHDESSRTQSERSTEFQVSMDARVELVEPGMTPSVSHR
jgi:hypothetical protein